ncbi:hypothetical protein [Litoreibacter ponti]|uniref:hypothetical protein n=1 Tax=Litoreibacter ponti TaxID=1510457 RepID=UPI001304ADC9|nr:hypothetical protein [Litoreibacter ponti]
MMMTDVLLLAGRIREEFRVEHLADFAHEMVSFLKNRDADSLGTNNLLFEKNVLSNSITVTDDLDPNAEWVLTNTQIEEMVRLLA